jgi:hypothetical protein
MKKIIFIFLILAICGCASTSLVHIDLYDKDLKLAAIDSQDVRVFRSQLPSDSNVTKIGEITIEGDEWAKIEDMFEEKAASIGADTVYIIHEDKQNVGMYSSGSGSYETILVVTGLAVKTNN